MFWGDRRGEDRARVICFCVGARVPFKALTDYLEGGESLGEFLEQYPSRDARGSACGAGRGAGQPDGASGMKVLIDECAPKALKVALAASGFDCTTVQEAGWSGKENGELLSDQCASVAADKPAGAVKNGRRYC